MRTYRNEQHGFEIDIPEDWSLDRGELPEDWTAVVDVVFTCGPQEILNINIEQMSPEPPPELTRLMFQIQARSMGYTNCDFGRIIVEDREHTAIRYQIAGTWSKKYLIVLGGYGYAITATCANQRMFSQRESVWDAIAASLRLVESRSAL